MKKIIVMMMLLVGLITMPTQKAHAIWWVVVKAAVKKAILAADLAIQRQQNKVIWLQNAQKTIENAMSKLKLEEISDWTEKQRSLYKNYFEELNKVKTIITYYKRIKEIGEKQLQLVNEYKRAWSLIRDDKHFRPEEISYIARVYQGILEETVNNVEQLTMVVNSFSTTMSDAKRLAIIGAAGDQVDQNYADLKRFNSENYLLSLSRSKNEIEARQLRVLYGIQQ
ncbi:conjugal transfer protein TraI [Chitinophaga defluvii]|uniref:Conjugal transfer protein TraI n=1 Tax=Chitinophaga defluvii TaxID=3163343 RepID=A0ABV2TCF7_9BACT